MTYDKKFDLEIKKRVKSFSKNSKLLEVSKKFNIQSALTKYSYNFSWAGVPVIQLPQDLICMQELIFKIKPDMIVETGIARGGSLIFYSSILSMIKSKYKVVGIDIDIRAHARKVLNTHKLAKKIITIKDSSLKKEVFKNVQKLKKKFPKVLVCLDSCHTENHVLEELKLYSNLVSKGSYIVVFDSTCGTFDKKNMDKVAKNYNYKPFGKKSNPLTAIYKFLKINKNFKIDDSFNNKALITNCLKGFLKKN